MPAFRLKITDVDLEELRRLVSADAPREAAAFALAGVSRHGSTTDILMRRLIAIPRDLYDLQEEHHLRISPKAINGLTALCQANGLGAVICHYHPGEIPYSPSDDSGEERIVDTLRNFIPSGAPTGSLLVTPESISGRVWLPEAPAPVSLTEIQVLGRAIRRLYSLGQPAVGAVEDIYDRQVRAFGQAGQSLIAAAKVGIVGVGGTGSPTAEQLVRLGVRDLVLIDKDVYDGSNITRVYGSFASSLGRRILWFKRKAPYKADIVAANLRRINPKARIVTITKNVALDAAARELLDRDVIFLCTDEHWGRSVVNEIAYQYLIPVINVGMRIKAESGSIEAAVGVVDVLRPDLPCLWCRQTLSAERIAAESMPTADRVRLAAEGYVQGLDDSAPSVVSITTTLSAIAVTMFLQLMTDFMGTSGEIFRLNYDVMEGVVRRGRSSPSDRCVCKKVRAFGDLKPRSTLV